MHGSFPSLAAIFAALFLAYGTESPFLPAFLGERGATPSQIGLMLAGGTVVRIIVTPFIGAAADRWRAVRGTLAVFGLMAGALSFTYLAGSGFAALLALSLLNAFATAPLAPLADAIALPAARRETSFQYGWVRGVGSGAFILGTLASGRLVAAKGLWTIVATSGVLFLLLGALARLAPAPQPDAASVQEPRSGWRTLLADPLFRRIMLVAALVIGSHALNDTFAVIRWREAGISAGTIGLLWSESVASEVVVFLLVGPPLLARLGPARCAALSALAGVLRWTVLAQTSQVAALAAIQLTHGLTFALLHLANMQLIGATVPAERTASAQTLYATVGLNVATAILTAASGFLYGHFGAQSFWLSAGLCGLALPLTPGLRRQNGAATISS
ncbi:MFS transporter [Lichenihabitans sp. Uapishka_5]|uniref:MFS transporter n=1 Tax=Lichenihabitans sp. Uapishka_5 TaxID=3037302 RepID=UPI0029E7E918|nr:MFS transporter [Lichenihabitans sp. Uapishka_5]MDX7951689.1 MFS transporter [Lichenihabitans sp. Uapishka_5]